MCLIEDVLPPAACPDLPCVLPPHLYLPCLPGCPITSSSPAQVGALRTGELTLQRNGTGVFSYSNSGHLTNIGSCMLPLCPIRHDDEVSDFTRTESSSSLLVTDTVYIIISPANFDQ